MPFWPQMMGMQQVPVQTPEQKERLEAAKRMAERRRQVWAEVKAEVTFDQWIRMGDEALCDRAVDKAWALFTEELAKIAGPWQAHIPMGVWVSLPLCERAQLGARFHEDHVLVEGQGTPPALIHEWAVPA